MASVRSRILAATLLLSPVAAHAQPRTPSVIPAFNVADLDRSTRACQDFNRFANGGWLDRNPVPAAYTSWGSSTLLVERNNSVLKQVLDRAARAAKTTRDPNTRLLGDFYASCMDSTRIEALGATPLAPAIARIEAIRSQADLVAALADAFRGEGSGGFVLRVGQDARNTNRVIAGIGQGGISLPDRDYYLNSDKPSAKMRGDFLEHVSRMLQMSGEPEARARADAQRVLALETAFAKAYRSRVELRNPNANYNLISIDSLSRIAPAIDWPRFLATVGLAGVREINVRQPRFIAAFSSEMTSRPLEDWKAYLRWKLVDRMAPFLSSAFVNQDFVFSSTLRGTRENLPRSRRCIRFADQYLGDALGREYAKTEFTPGAKAKMLAMVENLRAVLHERIASAKWMTAATRKQALAKLAAFTPKVGYPDRWRNYSDLRIERTSLAANVTNVMRVGRARNLAKLGKAVDRTEWSMTVPTVNAYYSPTMNEIVFPGGRLQPPFFHVSYDDPANYGGVGGTIGHEMSHGFDDQGRQFDAAGNLRDWWTPDDARLYTERASVVERQYSAYAAADSLYVNGKLTLGENIADVAGVSIAFEAMQRAMQSKPKKLINGFTPEQRFFLAYAQARRINIRPEQLRLMVQTDPHSPGQFRINGPLANMPEFAKAFGCKPGDQMVRPDSIRARIW